MKRILQILALTTLTAAFSGCGDAIVAYNDVVSGERVYIMDASQVESKHGVKLGRKEYHKNAGCKNITYRDCTETYTVRMAKARGYLPCWCTSYK